MNSFMARQIEIAERLFEMMKQDHDERTRKGDLWMEINYSLIQKLSDREQEIARFKKEQNA